jgi:hypothetical protein
MFERTHPQNFSIEPGAEEMFVQGNKAMFYDGDADHNQPVGNDAVIMFFSHEHPDKICMHFPNMADSDDMYYAMRLNSTPNLKWFETPVHSNFLYE